MKNLGRGLLMVIAVGVLIGNVFASPAHVRFDPDSAAVLGAVTTTTSSQRLVKDPDKYLEYAPPFRVTVVVADSGAGNGAATDSLAVSIVKWLDMDGRSCVNDDSIYTVIKTMPAFDPTKTFVLDQTFSVDSCDLGTFLLGGPFKVMLHKGGGQTLDTVGGDYTIDVYVESLKDKDGY